MWTMGPCCSLIHQNIFLLSSNMWWTLFFMANTSAVCQLLLVFQLACSNIKTTLRRGQAHEYQMSFIVRSDGRATKKNIDRSRLSTIFFFVLRYSNYPLRYGADVFSPATHKHRLWGFTEIRKQESPCHSCLYPPLSRQQRPTFCWGWNTTLMMSLY